MSPAAAEAPPLGPRSIGLTLLAVAVAAAPHASHLPVMIVLFGVASLLWRWMAARRGWPLPGAVLRVLLTVLALAGVLFSFGTVFGRDAGSALLVIMLGLKLLEARTHRDVMLVLFLSCFLVVAMAFHSQEIFTVAALVAALLLITTAMIDLNGAPRAGGPVHLPLRPAAMLMLQAVPLMVLMFVLFPRLPAPLWGLPGDAHAGITGLSDTMDPGSISRLASSDAVAFRVTFAGEPPPAEGLYWRGPVFWHTDGRRWSHDAQRSAPPETSRPRFDPRGDPIDYAVMLEPSNQRWLFALDLPYTAPPGSTHTRDLLLLAHRPVREPVHYQVTSFTDYRMEDVEAAERARALQLPDTNPRSRALGRAWLAEAATDADVVERALQHFRQEPFHYTLAPTVLGDDPVDAFLFDTRRGFCEHYATAFTVLMRSAGVPARVVTGYQGGEMNPIGGHLVVRQRDAHAWAEVWLAGRGWTRVDPTAAVAPERITRGSAETFGLDRQSARGFGHAAFGSLLQRAGDGWDVLNVRWNAWVLAYGPAAQEALLARLGLRSWLGMALALAAGMVAVLSAIAVIMQLRGRRGVDPLTELYGCYRAKLARRGLVAAEAEGPLAFASRARAWRPDLAVPIDSITNLYVAMRYGRTRSPEGIRRLRRAVSEFRP